MVEKRSYGLDRIRTHRMRGDDHRGFTLIELLVVIAVIAILIGILLPSLAAARGLARIMVCGSNMRQVASAIGAYAFENDEYHHAIWCNNGSRFLRTGGRSGGWQLLDAVRNSGDVYWGQLYQDILGAGDAASDIAGQQFEGLPPALPGWEVFACPETRFMLPGAFPAEIGDGSEVDPWAINQSYCFNGVFRGHEFTDIRERGRGFFKPAPTAIAPRRLTEMEFLSDMIMFQDGSETMIDNNGDRLGDLTQWISFEPQWIDAYYRHSGRVCIIARGDGSIGQHREGDRVGIADYIGFETTRGP